MHERRAQWSFMHLLPLLFFLFLLQPSYGDYVVKEIAAPGRYLNLPGGEVDLDFERDGGDEDVGADFLFVRLDSTYGGLFARAPPTDLSNNDSLTSQMIMPSGDIFPWYSTTGLSAQPTPVETRDCPWNTSACPKSKVYLRFDFLLVEDVDRTVGERGPFNLVTVAPYLRVDYEPASGIVRASWANYVISEASLPGGISDWTTVEVVVKPDTGEMDLVISTLEGERALGKIRTFVGPLAQPNSLPPAGIHVGPTNHTRRVLTAVSIASEETTDLKRSRRDVYSYERGVNVSALNFEGTNGFVRYDFRNRIKLPRSDAEVGREEVALDFVIKPGVTSGLLWFAEGTTSKSFIVIKDSKLYYKYIAYDETLGAKRTLTEEIVINETLEPGKTHRLRLNRYQDVLRLSLGTQQRFKKIISGKAPLIPENGVIYIGGSDNAAISTDGEVARNFDGSVTAAKITQEGSGITNLNMLELIRDPDWTRDVLRKGDVQYEYHMPFRPSLRPRQHGSLILMPTASTRGHAGITLHTSPMPVTFMGTQSSVVRFDTWDFSVFHSFEIEFRTFEPNGVLFFVGPDREHTDFVCVEIFDGNVYFAYGIGDHYRHIQLNPTSRKVNTGTAHRVYVERTPQHRFIVKYNGQEVDVDQGTSRHQAEFSSYTYFGSIDQPSRFPWIVWSRENFAGCINFIRVNDDKFLDPASRMNQHTDLSRGIQFGVCKAPDLRCNREICGGGQCHELSYPFFEPMNFACDCSASDKTFRDGVEDIRRSEACNRDAPIVDFDGETVVMIDFERQMNTLTTHTDDINLQFKTESLYAPLFVAVSTAEKQYFRVELENGLIKVSTNMNKASKPPRDAEFLLQSPRLNDNNWHTLRIRRRAQFVYISVDNASENNGVLVVEIPKGVFNNIAQQIYVGGLMPENYASPPYGNMAGFLPKGPKFVGEMRNFYWNQYDFFGTRQLPTHYTTDVLTPRLELPTFPSWPREPMYSITCTSKLNWGTIQVPLKAKEAGDMWLLEFKTKYDGVLAHARDDNTGSHFTLMILKGRLHLIYSIGGVTGVHEIINSPISVTDNLWHRVTFGLDRVKGRFVIIVDDSAPEAVIIAGVETFGHRLQHNTLNSLTFSFGGVPGIWSKILEIIRLHAPTSLPSGYEGSPPAFTGCLGGFSTRTDRFSVDLFKKYDANLESYPTGEIVRGYCRDLVRCTPDYCLHGGVCTKVSETLLRCDCTNTGYTGSHCEDRVTICPPNYCLNGGICTIVGTNPVCNCQGTGYYGDRCEVSVCSPDYCMNGGICSVVNGQPVCDCRDTDFGGARCDAVICRPDYCRNGGICSVQNGRPVCSCSGTGYDGQFCEHPICIPGYCKNGGICRIQGGIPICDCSGTDYDGKYCENPVCRPGYCQNGGRCIVENGRPVCECRGTGYGGSRCDQALCNPGYCLNGGRCMLENDRPVCDCRGTGYVGSRCDQAICPPGYCQNGGRCVVENGRPVCDCRGTMYGGSRCDQAICLPGYCQNGGRCVVENGRPVCDCRGTMYGGSRCDQAICPPGYCQNGGRCVVENGRPVCDCLGTGYGGSRCDQAICPPNYCLNGGRCIVQGGQPVCDCTSTRYQGRVCEVPICRPDFCLNGGQCIVQGDRAVCDCRSTGYDGINCETPICRPGYCMNGGVCTIVNGRPVCDCSNTGYGGQLCEQPICRPGFCLNGGRCIVQNGQAMCDCRDTGFVGQHCEQSICRPDYCMNGGICSVINGQPTCDCRNTGYGGPLCEQAICPDGFCLNGGRCTVQNGRPVCDCSGTDYRGDRCSHPICPPNFCLNGGVCYVYDGNPRCNCTGNFGGDRCHYPICPPGYCLNNGRCLIRPGSSTPECDCTGTGFTGDRCSAPVCPDGYCLNGGICHALPNGLPFCDCSYTDFTGDKCEVPICTPDHCSGHGTCRVEQGRPICECHLEYWGPRCQLEVCPSGFCHHGGTCYAGPDRRPHCRCPEGYEGDQCEMPKTCPPGYCYHGGECTMQGGMPVCNCINTDYQGSRCETPKTCPPGYCQNGGLCTVSGGRYTCNCLGTGFQGPTCSDPIACPPSYCHGGTCTVLPGGKYICSCWKTGHSGPTCDGDVNGIYVDYEKIGYMVYDLNPPLKTKEDNVTVGFKTYAQSGTILDFVTTNGAYWGIKVRNGHIVVDRNGQEYMYPNIVNDGAYHVVSIERKGDRMLVTFDNDQIVNLPMTGITERSDQSITYTTLYVGANKNKGDIFHGAIGGLYWNGRYPIDEAKGGLQITTGDVIHVLLPSFILPGKKPVPVCPVDYCFNGGICYVEDYELKCDCRLTGWQGSRCEKPTRGVLPSTSGNGAYVIINVVPPKLTNLDRMRVAFQTYATDGPIARFMSPDGRFYEIYMKGQQVFVSNSKDEIRLISAPYQQCDDGKMHVITLVRNGSRFDWSVDGHRTIYIDKSLVDSNGALITNEIILGADRKFTHSFNGVLGAFDWNGQLLVNDNGELSSESNVMIVPGRGVGKKEDVVIVVMPHFMQPPVATTAVPPLPFPPAIPIDGIHGGAIVGGAGEGGLFVPSMGYGGGASGVFAGSGPLLLQAGGAGFFGLINPWLAGILVCLLPLISALIWACWRCKPGCCPCCVGGAGGKAAGGKFHDTMDRISAGLWAPPPADKDLLVSSKPLLATNGSVSQTGNFHPVPPGGASFFTTGGQSKSGYVFGQDRQVDITDRYDMTTLDQHMEGVPNVYTTDDLKVDCCVLTQNSRYVVTGSANGPPQVWDMQTGEPFKVMNGDELGCSDLHLAVQDTLLVGQVIEDFQSADSTKMHRLQLWNFVTGEQLEMPAEILCSASCVSNAGAHIVAARATPQGQSILVWDLRGNQLTREIPYAPINPNARVSYINITPEDRLIVAGFNNPGTDQACFMVFDLAAEARGVVQPKYITFEAKAEATEILNNEEAVTGTRKGELIVWNLLTTTPVRQITINATLEGDNTMTIFPPHDGMIHDIVLSEDLHFLVTASQDRRVRVWTMPEERLLHTLEGHADDVLSVVVSHDSEMVVSGSWDGSIRVWRMKDGSQMCIFTSNIEVLQVKLSRDKRAIVGLGERNGHRKLIMMQIVRSRTCAPAVYTRMASPGSGGGGGLSPASPQAPLPEDLLP